MARKILTDDGKLEDEVEMDEAKSANKELGLPDLGDDEEGRKDSEEDGEGGTSKAKDPPIDLYIFIQHTKSFLDVVIMSALCWRVGLPCVARGWP